MSKYKIIIAEGNRQSMYINRFEDIKKELLTDEFECLCLDVPDEIGMLKHIEDVDALIVSPGMTVSEKSIKKLKKCKCVVSLAVGYDNIDIKLAGENGIAVANVPDYGTEEVADVAMAFILSLSRKINYYNDNLKEAHSKWNWRLGIPIHRLRSRALGIVGLGRIGTAVALRSKVFGFDVLFCDPHKEDGYDKALGIKRVNGLKNLLKESDIVTIHTPLTSETKGMINKDFLSLMKKGAILVNTARGPIFESLDIIEWALKNNIIQAVATDVLPQEPPDENHSLIKSWRSNEEWIKGRLIISPHAAFYSEEAGFDLCCKAVIAARDAVLGKQPRNIVNKEFLKGE
ncbi:MAG: C-terminal binding protein [Candidatus Omnitrophota bacterium]|nr:C-terminal binding protein [Candidatus Omnitrophota bacterium]